MTIPARLNAVTIGARDIAKLGSFYDALGWQRGSGSGDDFVIYRMAGAVLTLYPLTNLAEDSNLQAAPAGNFGGVSLGVNVERKEQVDEAIATARGAGAMITKDPIDTFWGGRSGYFSDPEGNLWEIAWAPMFRFDERGSLLVD
jgi:catechol 2,3-dioxygenase-like lactoylglutathione lyase family enzyme